MSSLLLLILIPIGMLLIVTIPVVLMQIILFPINYVLLKFTAKAVLENDTEGNKKAAYAAYTAAYAANANAYAIAYAVAYACDASEFSKKEIQERIIREAVRILEGGEGK